MDKTPDELAPGTRVITAPELKAPDKAAPFSPRRRPNKSGKILSRHTLLANLYHVEHDDGTIAMYDQGDLRIEPKPRTLAPGTRVVTAPELDPIEKFGAYRCPNKPGTVRENVVLAPSHRAVNHDDGTSAIYLCTELRGVSAPVPGGHATIPTEAGVYLYGDPSANKPGVAQLSVYETAPTHIWAIMGSAAAPAHELMTARAQRNGWVFSRLDGPWPPAIATTDPAPAGTLPLLDREPACGYADE